MPDDLNVQFSRPSTRFSPDAISEQASDSLRSILVQHRYAHAFRLPGPAVGSSRIELLLLLDYLADRPNSLGRTKFYPFYRLLETRRSSPETVALYELLWLQRAVSAEALGKILDQTALTELAASGLISRVGDGSFTASARCFARNGLYLLSDASRAEPDFVYFGTDSTHMMDVTKKHISGRSFERALDLCTGSGVQGLFVSRQSEEVICSDVNDRALGFVAANARLNEIKHVRPQMSDMFADISGKFDCITANTPYVPMKADENVHDLPLRGGTLGIEFPLRLIEQLPDYLSDGGVAIIYASDPIVRGKRRLLEEIGRVLPRRSGLNVQQINLSFVGAKIGYAFEAIKQHMVQCGIDGFDNCIVVLDRQRRFSRRMISWNPVRYWWTRRNDYLARLQR